MIDPQMVRMTQLVLWYDATRVNTWPDFIAGITDDERAATPVDFGRRHLTDRMTDPRHAAAEKLARNLPGLETLSDGSLILRGVGLLERQDGGYGLSPRGRLLRDQYRAKDRTWIATLAAILVDAEPRTRCLLKAIGAAEGGLELADGPAAMRWSRSTISLDGHTMRPFAKDGNDQAIFRRFVDDQGAWALGVWRDDPLLTHRSIGGLIGSQGKPWSMHDISLAFRASVEVFLAAGCLIDTGSCLRVQYQSALAALGPTRCAELGWSRETADTPSVLSRLRHHCEELRSPTGHVVASALVAALRSDQIPDPEQAIAGLESGGSIEIHDTDYGQSRHGRGLYGDPRRQLIKIRFLHREGFT